MQAPSQRRRRIVRIAVGGAAGIALVAGGVVGLTFGSMAATAQNLPVIDAMQVCWFNTPSMVHCLHALNHAC